MRTELVGIFAILMYLASSGLLVARLIHNDIGGRLVKAGALGLALGAAILHVAVLYPVLITASGLNFGFFNAASLIGVLMVLLLLLTTLSNPTENLGIILMPAAAATVALMLAYPSHHLLSEQTGWRLDLHIVLSVSAYSTLAIASIQAILLAIQDFQLRQRRLGRLMRALPPLQVMEGILFQLIWIGFALLSLALLSGFFFLEDIFAQHLAHKTILSIVAWLVFAVLLWGRHRFGWRGQVAIRWSLGGFAVLMLAYFGSKLVLELVLQRY